MCPRVGMWALGSMMMMRGFWIDWLIGVEREGARGLCELVCKLLLLHNLIGKRTPTGR
jgi:hypothetical protein